MTRARGSGSRSCGELRILFFSSSSSFFLLLFECRFSKKNSPFFPSLSLPLYSPQHPSYNIGGSGWDCPGKSDMRPGGAVPSFLGPDWKTYDWSLDAGQRWTLLAARDRGASVFEAFSNSPPCFMTNSGYASGNWDANNDNLPSKNYEVRQKEKGGGVEWGGNEEEGFFLSMRLFEFFNNNDNKKNSSLLCLFPEQINTKKHIGLRLLPRRGGLLLQGGAQHHLQVKNQKSFFPLSKGVCRRRKKEEREKKADEIPLKNTTK